MHLNCLAQKSPPSTSRQTLDGVFLVFAIFYFFRGVTVYFWATGEDETTAEGAEPTDLQGNFYAMTLIVDFLFIVYLIAVSTRGRMSIRDNYQIPGDCVTDCIVSTACHPCALSQMARQSANYRDHGYRWCSDTGVDEKYDGEYGLNMSDGVHSMNMSDRDLI
jgi:Cys-rich protein (TIGR01571 family)